MRHGRDSQQVLAVELNTQSYSNLSIVRETEKNHVHNRIKWNFRRFRLMNCSSLSVTDASTIGMHRQPIPGNQLGFSLFNWDKSNGN